MKQKTKHLLILCAGAVLVACTSAPAPEELPTLIPAPEQVTWERGSYRLPDRVRIGTADARLAGQAGYLAESLAPYVPEVSLGEERGEIELSLDTTATAPEAYRLSVSPKGIRIAGGSPRGVANGIATLRQLLPAATDEAAVLPCAEIADKPAFEWRGAMLDVSRHFFDKEEICRLIDQMAQLKLNKFHWHLTDDQGWRVEIKAYPELTRKGAWRRYNKQDRLCMERAVREQDDDFRIPAKRLRTEGADTLYGGYYTQQEIREVVAYAAARGIDIVPEIDMPGHFLQAIECYPQVTCFKPTPWDEEGFSAPLCPGKEEALAFCRNIWKELFELFPYEFVHIGGDEVNMTNWSRCPRCRARMRAEGLADGHELQAWFTRQMQRFFEENGRRMIGWDELLQGGVDSTATIMWWRPWETGTVSQATRLGCDVILCPSTWFYLSFEEDAAAQRRTAEFEMLPDSLSPEQLRRIRGVQGNVWAEKVPTWARVEYLLYPRLPIVAEKGWCDPKRVRPGELAARTLRYCDRLEAAGINFRIPSLENYHERSVFTDSVRTTLSCPYPGAILRYTCDGSVPTETSPRYTAPITIREEMLLQVRAFHPNGKRGDWVKIRYEKSPFAPAAEVGQTRPGLQAEWFFARFPDCAAIGGKQPDGCAVVDSVGFPEAARGRIATGILFRGYIRIPKEGIYTFEVASDDGSLLRIGDRVVIENEGEHALIAKTGQAALAAGLHPIELRYFDYNGGEVSLHGVDDSGKRIPLDGEWLCHDAETAGKLR